ncbi:T9SS type A sorting domain-containing protein [Chryseobacterium sp. MYb264]|uniref:T9SS type A sorting domain-containing protein n=1 Tax=Chryseobacterium sp. MYb264 TaxID=2745153 RepID=UPI002E10BA64|nr:T9SS type A sorting domain-containing protein [Chryseobacterium sp. MYb264]
MRKLLFSAALFTASLSFGQITLEHTFPQDEIFANYSNDTELYYCSQNENTPSIKIYNSDFALLKTLNLTIPTGYTYTSFPEDYQYPISKYLFNTNDKLEFIVFYQNLNGPASKMQIIDEDGIIIKDFPGEYRMEYLKIYHDPIDNVNKLQARNEITAQTEVYTLPTSVLANKEIMNAKNKLVAFPNPAKTTLKVTNPKNNFNKVEVFDVTGKLVLAQSFSNSEETISLHVENLTTGNYIYKIGNLSSKFIKE